MSQNRGRAPDRGPIRLENGSGWRRYAWERDGGNIVGRSLIPELAQ